MLKGFREFVLRGNIVELAVAFVIGAAFAALVEQFVSAIVTPILAVITPGQSQGFGFRLVSDNPATFINIGTLVNSVIVFVLTAFLVYLLLVVPMNKLRERREARMLARGEELPPELQSEAELLTEIRDLLQQRNNAV